MHNWLGQKKACWGNKRHYTNIKTMPFLPHLCLCYWGKKRHPSHEFYKNIAELTVCSSNFTLKCK